MSTTILTTDDKGRLSLPEDFTGCPLSVERNGDQLIVRKVKPSVRRFSFKELMAGVTTENIHAEIKTGSPRGEEQL